jgi:hypothetical protein
MRAAGIAGIRVHIGGKAFDAAVAQTASGH